MTDITCSVEGCASVARPIGMCIKHYKADHYQKNKARYDDQSRTWKAANPERYKALMKAYFKANPEKWASARAKLDPAAVSAYNAAYRASNLERIRTQKAASYQANREAVNERNRRNYQANRVRAQAGMRLWAAANPERVRELARESKSRRRAREHGGFVGRADYRRILEEFGMTCHICGGSIESPSDLHFDHVIPLAKGGPHSSENIRPAHALCNRRKGVTIL